MSLASHRTIRIAATIAGGALFVLTLRRVDMPSLHQFAAAMGPALPAMLLPAAAWQLVRTLAWQRCFPRPVRPPLGTIARVRLAAEAFSYLTVSGVTGEPLKVSMLNGRVPAAVTAASIAVERVAYLVVTAAMIAASAALTLAVVPLSPGWGRAFAWIGVAATLFALIPIAVWRRRRAAPVGTPSEATTSPARSFVAAAAEQFRVIASADRREAAALIALEALAFCLMAMEVYVVLWFSGDPVSLVESLTIETFTRISSLAAALIPANLGALEASNIAVAGAVQASTGAVALAMVRRIRGLLFCAAGLLIYPGARGSQPHRTIGPTLTVIQDADSDALIDRELGGMPAGERIARAAYRAGFTRLAVWSPRHAGLWRSATRRAGVPIEILATADAGLWHRFLTEASGGCTPTMLAPGFVPSPADLLYRPAAGSPVSTSMPVRTTEQLAIAERQLRASIFKPTDDRLARFNRRFSVPISVWLIRHVRLRAHAMSAIVMLAGLYSGWLFGRGTYAAGVAAALLSWAASVLDGCDGELARLQYQESALGCWIDTLGDYVYYLAVFAGLVVGAERQWPAPSLWWWCGGLLATGLFMTLALLILLRQLATDGRPERLRSRATAHFRGTGKRWARLVAQLSTCATRATMPYGLVALSVVGVLPVAVILAVVGSHIYWISLAREFRQLVKVDRLAIAVDSAP